MKLAKMSLVAALLLGANAYAIDNVKVNGDAKLFYATSEVSTDGVSNEPDLFDKDASAGQAALRLGITADLTDGVSTGATLYAISTLGLENNLVSNVWESGTKDQYWMGELWIAGTAGKTTGKVGRMELDTPLAFTEKWSIVPNTFEAGVVINQDLPDTTLVAAYIGKGNGSASVTGAGYGSVIGSFERTQFIDANGNGNLDAGEDIVGIEQNDNFGSFYDGAYAVGAVNNSFAPLTAQAWYYDLQSVAKAYWLQADLDMEGILVGAQYANIDLSATGAKEDTAYAVMLGYAMKDVLTVKAAYSSVDDEGSFGGIRNVATGTGYSKLYTEMWWNYGNAGATGSDTFSITAEGTAADIDLFAGYYMADIDVVGTADDREVSEITLSAGKSFGALDVTAVLIFDDYDYGVGAADADESATTLQAYLTYNF